MIFRLDSVPPDTAPTASDRRRIAARQGPCHRARSVSESSVRLLHGFIRSILWSALFPVHRNGRPRKENPYGKMYCKADIFETGHRVPTRHTGFSHRFRTRCRILRAPRMRENHRQESSCHKNKEGARMQRAPSSGFFRFRSGLPHSSRRMFCAGAPPLTASCAAAGRPVRRTDDTRRGGNATERSYAISTSGVSTATVSPSATSTCLTVPA